MDWRDRIHKVSSDDSQELINLTPHDIHYKRGEEVVVIKSTGKPARVNQSQKRVGTVGGIPVNYTAYEDIDGLPEYDSESNVVYIVSSIVAQALASSDRSDYVVPDSGPTAERDEDGQIKAVTGWIVYDSGWGSSDKILSNDD